jgi:hypothetical protein
MRQEARKELRVSLKLVVLEHANHFTFLPKGVWLFVHNILVAWTKSHTLFSSYFTLIDGLMQIAVP